MQRPQLLLSLCLAAGLVGCASPHDAPAGKADATQTEKVRRVAGMLDYVAADYPGSVDDHGGLSASGKTGEYEEQVSFLQDADALARELPAPPTSFDPIGKLTALRDAVAAKAPGAQVTAQARALRKRMLEAYQVVLAPTATPSYQVGKELYATCVQCHGATGKGDGALAHTLEPPPRDFTSPEVMNELSPVRAFNALTDGVEGTKMEPYQALSQSQRWSLAFYLFTLRHQPAAAKRGRAVYDKTGKPIAAAAGRLANERDGDILATLKKAGASDAEAMDGLAYLRRDAAFTTTGAPMDKARKLLAAAVGSLENGKPGDARRQAAAAYLDGFEPHEAALGARDRGLLANLEGQFLAVRENIGSGADPHEIEQQVLRIGTLLDRADEVMAGHSGVGTAVVASFTIILREGLEGALLVLLLLGIARRSGAGEEDVRAVHYGWLAAVGVGIGTWFGASSIIQALGGAQRELMEGVVSLFAAAVLLGVSHFVLARIDAQRRVHALKQRLARAASSPRRKLVLASLAFVAVYREAFEVVLFLQAVVLDAETSAWAMLAGAAGAMLVLISLVFAMTKLGKRLRPGPLLTALGTMLCLLAVALAGKGVRALQEAGVLGIQPVHGPRFEWLGIYPTMETLLAQALVFAAFIALAAWAMLKNRSSAAAAAAPASASSRG